MQVNLSHISNKKNQKNSATHLFWSRLETLLSKKQKYVFDQTQEGAQGLDDAAANCFLKIYTISM